MTNAIERLAQARTHHRDGRPRWPWWSRGRLLALAGPAGALAGIALAVVLALDLHH